MGADINVVKAVLSGRVITSGDYKTHLNLTVEAEGSLPIDILDILERNCPVHGSPKKVKDTHLLAWIPNDINLEMLSHAVGGKEGKVLWSNWFVGDSEGAKHLEEGKWILIPDKCPADTLGKNSIDSPKHLPSEYHQPDALSFAVALIMHFKNSGERWYSDQWAWCNDKPTVGAAAGMALDVGAFNAHGLIVNHDDPDRVRSRLGCAASWNF